MPQRSVSVDATANRLRLIQIEFADASEKERKKHLSDAIEQSLKTIHPQRRREYLGQLETRFPTWDIRVEGASPSAEPSGSIEPPPEINDWTFLLQHLLRVAEDLSEDERQTLVDRLAEAGLVPPGQAEWPRSAEKELRSKLRIDERQPLVPERVLQLAGMLTEFARGLESVWNTWKKIGPTSRFKKSAGLQKAIADFVTGGQDMTRGYVKPDLDRLRQLIAGITNAVALFGRQIAEKYLAELSPDSVKSAARPRGALECKPAPWWEKYEELAWGPTADTIQRDMENLVAKNTEIIIKGLT